MSDHKSKKILIVDDEPDVVDLVSYHLKARGYQVQTVLDPNSSIGTARSYSPDLVILDIMMPDLNGIQICRILRADSKLKNVPIVFLTAKGEEADRITGFETGCDDYICKPFSIKELILRVQSILHRVSQGASDDKRILQIGQIVLDIECHKVTVQGRPIELTATEFKLLRLLIERRGRVHTREHLLINVWNYETEIETRTVDTHIRRLREKLGPEADWIETVRGVGYRMAERKAEACSI
ncbi:MAG TPA: response regulator transcription factor [Opitutaceae bacterium]|nr:response regulator transcription factor [Opitutaceae bacterium]